MSYIPILLDLEKINIVIFGGGRVAYRKLEYFLGSDITVVSEDFIEEIERLNVKKVRKKIEKKDDVLEYILNADLVIIATNDKKINSMIMEVCIEKRKIFNLVDDKKSRMIFPAFIEKNGIILAVSTSGRVPALSSFIRDRLSTQIEEYSKSLDVLEKIRKSLDSHDQEKRREFFKKLLDSEDFWKYIKNEELDHAYEYAMSLWRGMNVFS
ncbi:MAG: precorrin-2 dehydrogenase/sirohydrochlorin ferrochelatase family protein [Thermoplasmata archaeon]